MNVAHEVELLIQEIKRLGSPNAEGKLSTTFGVLFKDDKCANLFEALVGTLRAAKRKKIVTYDGELLLQGVHDNVEIVLLKDDWRAINCNDFVAITQNNLILFLECIYFYIFSWSFI